MLSCLIPHRKEYYQLIAALADRLVAGGNAAYRRFNGLGGAA